MSDCVGFVFEPSSSSDRGSCTYFSRIDSAQAVSDNNMLALTTSTQWPSVFTPTTATSTSITKLSGGPSISSSFEPRSCNRADDLHSASGAAFEGATIRTDGGVKLCQDCANRCYVQMNNC